MTSEALLGASGRGLPAGSAGGGTAGCPGVFQHRDPVLFLKLPRTKDDGQLPSMSTQLLKAAVPAETGLGDSEDASSLCSGQQAPTVWVGLIFVLLWGHEHFKILKVLFVLDRCQRLNYPAFLLQKSQLVLYFLASAPLTF